MVTGGRQTPGGHCLGWILFSFFLHFIFLSLALDHLAQLVVAGML